jgi:HEAT repeat protein
MLTRCRPGARKARGAWTPRNLEVVIVGSVLGTGSFAKSQLSERARCSRADHRLAAVEAMGQVRSSWARTALAEALSDEWALVRYAAAQGLAASGAGPSEGASTQLALDALGNAQALPALDELEGFLGSSDLAIRHSAVGAIGRLGGAQHLALLLL